MSRIAPRRPAQRKVYLSIGLETLTSDPSRLGDSPDAGEYRTETRLALLPDPRARKLVKEIRRRLRGLGMLVVWRNKESRC